LAGIHSGALCIFLAARRLAFGTVSACTLVVTWYACAANWVLALSCLSEPTFIAATLASLLFALRHIETDQRRWLIWAAIWAGAAVLTRYAGAFWIMSLGLFYGLRWLVRPNRRHLADALILGTLSGLPALVMSLRNEYW